MRQPMGDIQPGPGYNTHEMRIRQITPQDEIANYFGFSAIQAAMIQDEAAHHQQTEVL